MKLLFYDDQDLEARLRVERPSLFLAGPTARGVPRTPWRTEAIALLEKHGFTGTVVLPEFRSGVFADLAPRVFGTGTSPVPGMKTVTHNVLRWETTGIEGVTTVLFWMPFRVRAEDDPESLPGFTTRAEVSRELQRDASRLVLGMPPGAVSGGHIRYHASRAGVPIAETLEETVRAALARA